MDPKNSYSFSLRRLLFVPIIYGILFAVFHTQEAAIPVFISATAITGLLFITNKNNSHLIVISVLGCLLGHSFYSPIVITGHHIYASMSENIFHIAVGVLIGFVIVSGLYHLVSFIYY